MFFAITINSSTRNSGVQRISHRIFIKPAINHANMQSILMGYAKASPILQGFLA